MLADTAYDVVVLDATLPDADGFVTCRRLRSSGEWTPIIMVTTRGEAPNVETGYESGCNDYLTKPIDAVALLAKIHDYLGE